MHGPLNVKLMNEYFGLLIECLHVTSVIVIVISYRHHHHHHLHHHEREYSFSQFEWAQ